MNGGYLCIPRLSRKCDLARTQYSRDIYDLLIQRAVQIKWDIAADLTVSYVAQYSISSVFSSTMRNCTADFLIGLTPQRPCCNAQPSNGLGIIIATHVPFDVPSLRDVIFLMIFANEIFIIECTAPRFRVALSLILHFLQ